MVSRSMIAFFSFAFFFPLLLCSQSNDASATRAERYRLDIPKEWIKPKLVLAITEILPQTIDELKEMEFCTEGKAKYSVQLVMSIPVILNELNAESFRTSSTIHYTLSFSYKFHSALYVLDSTGTPIASLQLVSPNEVFDYRQQFTQNLQWEANRPQSSMLGSINTRKTEAPVQNSSYKSMRARNVLTESFLLEISEKNVYEIRKMLKKLTSN